MNITMHAIAQMIDHSLLHPTMTAAEMRAGCLVALKHEVASVCIKPYAVPLASEILAGSPVAVGTVVGFPHGNSHIALKVAEAARALAEGASEIDMVVNVGQVLSQDWDYIQQEIAAVNQATLAGGGLLKVIFENDYLERDADKIRLCQICSEVGVAFVKTSSGYGFVKGPDGKYSYQGASDHDLALMRQHSAPPVQVKAAGGVRTLDDVLRVRALGVTRIGATATESILTEARVRGYPD